MPDSVVRTERATLAPAMADDETPGGEVICMPCRGTGTVISNLGGEPSTKECPWCKGSGRPAAEGEERDAQAHWGGGGPEPPEPPDAAA